MKKSSRIWIGRGVALAIGLGMELWLIQKVGFRRFAELISHASPWWVLAAVAIYAVSWVFRTWRLERLTSQAGTRIRVWELFRIHIAGYALNAILPVKLGDAATICYLKFEGIPIGRSAAIVVQTRLLDLLAIVLLFVPTLGLVLSGNFPRWILPSYLICIAVAAAPILTATLDRKRRIWDLLRRFEERLGHGILGLFCAKARDAYLGYHEMISNKKALMLSIALSLAAWSMDILTCRAIAAAVGQPVSLIVITMAVAIGNIGKSAPTTPGSVGVYEGLLTTTMVFFGLPYDTAMVIAFLDHMIKKSFNLILGLPMAAGLGFNISNWRELSAQKEAQLTLRP